jgi:cytochrome P450
MWNPLKKKSDSDSASGAAGSVPDMKDLGMLQKFAMKRLEKMSPTERTKMMKKAMTPKNIQKHKGEIVATLEAMKKSGQMSDDQYRLAKRKFGL